MDNSESFHQSVYTDSHGREFHYIHVDRGNNQLGVHFSAFFGDWGDDPKYRKTFGGYFHRLRMLGTDGSIDWLFLCDAFGADENGTYYIGKHDDPFVENAMFEILKRIGLETRYVAQNTVTIGSSMGATAALKFGLIYGVKGIIAISPHIDLDISAKTQNRERHVSWILEDSDTQNSTHFPITRQIRLLLDVQISNNALLPSLFVQSCRDDKGVHFEQAVPLVKQWRNGRGVAWFDERRFGGHTSEFATRALLLDVVHRFLGNEQLDIRAYKWSSEFRPYGFTTAFRSRIRERLARFKRYIITG